MQQAALALGGGREGGSPGCGENNNKRRRRPPKFQKQKSDRREPKIRGPEDGARPDWRVECPEQDPDDSRIDPLERGLHHRALMQRVPKRERAYNTKRP